MLQRIRISGTRLPELHGVLLGSAVVQAGGMFLTLLLGVQLARFLGPASYGIYGICLAVVSILGVPAQAGLPLLATRDGGRAAAKGSDTDLRSLFSWFIPRTLLFAALSCLCALAIIIGAAPRWTTERPVIVALSAGLTVALALSAVTSALLRGVGLNLIGQSLDILVKPGLTAAAVLLLFLASRGLTVEKALAVQLAAAAACAAVAACIFLIKSGKRADRHRLYDPGCWERVAAAFTVNSLLIALNSTYPVIVAGYFASASDVGVLRAALSAAALLALPASIANIATLPIVAREAAEDDVAAVRVTLSHTTLATVGATSIVLSVVILFGRPAIVILFGKAYQGSYLPLIILGASQLLISCFGIAGSYLNVTGREVLVVKAFALAVPSGLAASVGLGYLFGIAGISAGTLVMAAVWHFYIFIINRREIDVPLFVVSAAKHAWGRP